MAKHERGTTVEGAEDAREVRKRIERWRRTRAKRGPMPEELWQQAVALARRTSVYRTSTTLGVNYATLKWHVAEAESAGGRAGFVEVVGLQPPASEVVVELADAGGTRMTVRTSASGAADVAELASALWRERR